MNSLVKIKKCTRDCRTTFKSLGLKKGQWLESVVSANWGSPRIQAYEVGKNILSTLPGGYGLMTGTSQATAIHTGKLARQAFDIRNSKYTRNVCSPPTRKDRK